MIVTASWLTVVAGFVVTALSVGSTNLDGFIKTFSQLLFNYITKRMVIS